MDMRKFKEPMSGQHLPLLLAPCRAPARPQPRWLPVGTRGSLVALNAALKPVLYLLNKYCCSCLSHSLGLWGEVTRKKIVLPCVCVCVRVCSARSPQ